MAEVGAPPAQTAFVGFVPEAEPRIGAIRERFDPALRLGVPAHLTLLFPFMPPQRVHRGVLRRAAAALARARPFGFRLARAGRFEGSVHLLPNPAEPFAAGPIVAECRHVALPGRGSGSWRTMHLLPL